MSLIVLIGLAACGDHDATQDMASTPDVATSSVAGHDATSFVEGLDLLGTEVDAWRSAETLDDAHAAAEAAANLVVGPNGPDYGDRDGDGMIGGGSGAGILPGVDGTPIGLASPLDANECVDRDVLGGIWDEPQQRWDIMSAAIGDWTPTNNTMPSLPSHSMRVVGWATFTLASDSLDDAHEYAGHAQLHVDISTRALDC